ncbi:MAG: sensor histidine kinase [Sphingobacteriales bacterium]
MRFAVFLFIYLSISLTCRAQQQKYTAYTVNDGLPSNYVYRCVEDNKGFLWVATDAGIARFDGKHFQVFTTGDGLPDNEVLAVVKENDGRIWVNCFKQGPAYFDELQNRFINAKTDSDLTKVNVGTSIMFLYTLKDGGVMYTNEKGSFIFRDKKLTAFSGIPQKSSFLINENTDGTQLRWGANSYKTGLKTFDTKLYKTKGTKLVDSITLRKYSSYQYIIPAIDNGVFYNFNHSENKCFVYSNINNKSLGFKVDSISIPEPFIVFGFTGTWLNFYANSGKIYVFDKKTLKPQFIISGKYAPNSLFNDSKGNIWISTIDKGLILYKKKQFDEVAMPPNFSNTNFFSINRKPDGTLLAGNYYGEVLETNGKNFRIRKIPQKSNMIFRQRKILLSQNKTFTFSEAGTYANYSKEIIVPNASLFYAKTAINYNDSIIIVGQVSAIYKLNTVTEKVVVMHSIGKRITALAKVYGSIFYYGSTDGLYKYDYAQGTSRALTKNDPLLSERVTALCITGDSLLWVATAGKGLIAVKNDKIIFHITTDEGIISNSTRSITAAPGQIWLGTAQGISVVNYKLKHNKVSYAIQNLSINDGLTNNVINEMLYQKDTVYAATGDGISVIPAGIAIPKFNIPVQLIRMTVNQRDTILSSVYKLGYNQQYIQMQFAGIELSGHFKNLQYTLDKNKNWISLDVNTLTVQLASGNHIIKVRAADVNGNISNKLLTIQFDIATPFWQTIWFWLIIALVIQTAVIFLLNRRLKKKREAKLAKEIAGVQTASLEQQAFTSLMNPHFIFNALNSIQHYINVQDRQNANRYLSDFASLIRKNFEAAQQSFIPLEQEIENIKIYLRLEQMRFNDRFNYQIAIDDNLDVEDWMVPTMILQPLLENALLHGIMPSAIAGKVIIDFKEQAGNLLITITDNGIGIANSLALKETGNGHRSRSTELIKKRVAALSRFGSTAITITMEPAFESKKNPGNKITLFIPAELHEAWLRAQRQK